MGQLFRRIEDRIGERIEGKAEKRGGLGGAHGRRRARRTSLARRASAALAYLLAAAMLLVALSAGGLGAAVALADEGGGDEPPAIQYVELSADSATASSVHIYAPQNTAANAIDGDTFSTWQSGDPLPQWIMVDLGGVYNVTQLRELTTYFYGIVVDHEIWLSADGDAPEDFELAYSGSWQGNGEGVWNEDNFGPEPARYVKLVATSARRGDGTPDSIAMAAEIQIGYVGEGVPAVLPTGIALASPPAKTAYVVGEPLDAAGLSVIASFSDGARRELGAGEYRLSGYNMQSPGVQSVEVSWRSFSASFEIAVEALIQGELEYVPSGNLTATASSYTGGSWGEGPENAVDGVDGTKWCTSPDAQLPQWIAIDLGEVCDNVTQLRYFLDGGEWTARIMGYEIWLSEDGEAWSQASAGEWPNVPGVWREANFAPSRARFVKLVATSAGQNEADPASRASAGEIQIGYEAYGPDYPAFAADSARILVSAGESASVRILKNAAAQALSGIYDIEAPDGITPVSGTTFAAGSGAADDIVFAVSESYTAYTAAIRIVPQSPAEPEGGAEPTRYRAITVTARNDGLGLIDERTTVIRPAYRSQISGDTEIEFICPGGLTASVFAQKQGDATPNGTRVAIGGIIQLEDGRGAVTFPADEFPKGPITLRIRVWGPGGGDIDDCYLQLYNLGGVDWKAGLAAAPANPVTEGMSVTFSDDFKAMPSISLSGEGTTYASAKPDESDGGHFGFAVFEEYGGPYDPFSIAGDEYMQITTTYRGDDYKSDHAEWNQKATTGFLSSLAMDGSGFHTQGGREQYFEARIFCPPTPGMWPAFWTLTADNYADNEDEYIGVDELDIIEGYMAWPDRYAIANHAWIDTNPSKSLPQSQVWPQVDTEQFGYVNLAMGFHTFGMLIAEDVTRYYYDNVEVHSHPTMALSWESGNFFIVNGAISEHIINKADDGTYEYDASPKGFFRYGDENNMYIDWVRVYEEDPSIPSFKAEAAHVVAPLGEESGITIKKNAAAQALAGVYEVALPDGGGWEVVAGAAFEAGSESDTITLKAPEAYSLSAQIFVTPIVGDVHYPAIRFTASPSDAAGGELVAVNASTLPYVSADASPGEGAWVDYSGNGLAGKPHSFDFTMGGGWWCDGWGWMRVQNPGTLEFSFEGTSIALKAIKGDYGGEAQIFLDGELVDTIDMYSTAETTETVFERTGLPAARHKLGIKSVSGEHMRLTGFEYTYVPAEAPPGGELVAVNASTLPFVRADGGTEGAWANYAGSGLAGKPHSFDFGLGGGWWNDGWGWMRVQNPATLEFSFEGTSIALKAIKGDYGGATQIWLDGVLADTVDMYSAAETTETVFERAGLPAARHTLRIQSVSGAHMRLTGFEYTYVPLATVPVFTSNITALRATPGATLSYPVERNAYAQELSGSYELTFPGDGWEILSGASFAAGSALDEILVKVPDGYEDQNGQIVIVPVDSDGTRYAALRLAAKAPAPAMADIISLISPEYRAEIEGQTTLDFVFLGGYAQAEAWSLLADGKTVALVGGPAALDETGRGSIAFDAEALPHGPVTVRVIASKPDGTRSIDNYLQFWNKGGAAAKAGLGNAPLPSQLEGMGMELVFADDYREMPTISADGTDAEGNKTTYISHKPDGGDYGRAQFADYGSVNDPFAQVEDYMKITTQYRPNLIDGYGRKHTTGFLASVDRQGEGFHTDGFVNQYFEARFLSGASPSLWPAFWTLSANNYAGAVGPCDELDIIEGYMAWPDGYSIASHGWGDHPQPDIAGGKSVRTEELYGQQGNITMGFHTYGMLITEDYTYYYFDNDLVLTAPTLIYSWREGNYFMINNAMSDHSFPEGYGFERYGDASHMYIDWVRVYQQPADPDAVRFISDIRVREVKPGDTLSVAISRSEGAQAISGAYDVALPAGWTLLSGAAFAAGQAEDTLVFKVDENYTAYSAQIAITPVGSDGTRYRPVLIDTRADTPFFIEIYPSFETGGADGGEWAANVRLVNGFEAGTLAGGYIDVAAPAEAAGRYAFGSIPAGQSATVKLPGGDLKLLELTEYSINVVREDGYERKASKLLSSLTAARNDPQAPVVIDGAFTEAEWAGAMPVDLGAGQATNYGASRPWGGENDISAKGRLKWDDEYLYFGVSVKDDIHFEEADTISSWGSDSLQFSMDPGRIAGYAGDHPRFIAAVNSATGAYGLEAESWGQLPGSPTAGALMRGARHEDTKTTDYEIALRWASILPSGSLPAGAGSSAALDLGFSFLVNDNDADANGRVGWMSYMGGIGIGKNAAEFGDLLLSDLAALPDGAGGTGPGPDPEPGDKSALGLMVDNLGGIYTGIFTEESAGAYADALDGANDVLELEGATQEAIDDAAVALAEAFDGLALADEYSAYGELVELLLGVARLDGREYTEASWKNLQTVAADAWAFIELATGGAQSAEASGAEAFGAGAFGALGEGAGEGDELSVLADISADIAKWLVAVQEALAALEAAGSGEPAGPGAKMFAGIHADAAAAELAEEEIAQSGMPAVGFTLKGDGIAGAGTVNVRLSFRTADIEDGGVEFSLPGSIAAKAKLSATNVVDLVPPQEPLIGGYTTYSVYILANGSETFDADGGAALLNIALKPKAANQAAVSLILSHLDIAYTESGGEAAIADTGIDASVATTALRVYSRFDINRDGAVTLVDVDIVRASLGKRRADDGTWESERAARCDFDGNGVIEIADLTCAIAKYEATVL